MGAAKNDMTNWMIYAKTRHVALINMKGFKKAPVAPVQLSGSMCNCPLSDANAWVEEDITDIGNQLCHEHHNNRDNRNAK